MSETTPVTSRRSLPAFPSRGRAGCPTATRASPPTDASTTVWLAVPSRARGTSERTAVSIVPAFRPTAFLFYSTTPSTQPQRGLCVPHPSQQPSYPAPLMSLPRLLRAGPPTRYVHRAIPGPVPPGSLRASPSHPPVRASHQPRIPFHQRCPVFRMDAPFAAIGPNPWTWRTRFPGPGGTGQKFCAEVLTTTRAETPACARVAASPRYRPGMGGGSRRPKSNAVGRRLRLLGRSGPFDGTASSEGGYDGPSVPGIPDQREPSVQLGWPHSRRRRHARGPDPRSQASCRIASPTATAS